MRIDFQPRNAAAIRRQAGMSLAEVLFASAIFAIILIAALVAYDRSNRMFTQGVASSDLQQSTRVAFEKLLSEVRMAGFDYDRDGSPSDGEQQPDEQIEFAGVSAITIRGNLDYFTDVANSHGLEPDYVPTVANKFDTVTTANEEIVTFALKSANNAVNVQQIKFYADVARPRAAYPGGTEESLVTIGGTAAGTGYDLCDDLNGCSDPPYTLYRIALQRDGTPGTPVPIADNIHSLYFTYYTTANQTTLATVTETGVTATRTSRGAVGGLGQYDPDNIGTTDNFVDRGMRSDIRSILVELTGTTQNKYYEGTKAGTRNRTYTLQTLVVPRNFGHAGSADPHLGPPGSAAITSVCTGHCGMAHVTWSAPTTGGAVDKYSICYDTNLTGTYSGCVDASLNLEVDVSGGLVSGQTYFFKVKALNTEGQSWSTPVSRTVRNNTQPGLPEAARVTGASGETGIQLSFPRPTANTTAFDDLLCTGAGSTNGTAIPAGERILYTVWRSTDPNFNPATSGEKVVDGLSNQGAMVTIIDNAANKPVGTKGPAACVNYYYRIQTSDACVANATWNEGNNIAIATNPGYVQPVGTAAFGPYMISPSAPAVPNKVTGLSVDMANSSCNPGNGKCSINLDWTAVTAALDTSLIAVDKYRIKRWRKAGVTGTREAWPIDAAQPDGYLMSGALTNGETFTDAEGLPATTPQPPVKSNSSGVDYLYYYTVEAMNCTQPGEASDEVQYPTCYFDNTQVLATGALTGSGDPGNEWVLAGGDLITVSHATRVIREVKFTVTDPAGAVITAMSPTLTAAPWRIAWIDQTDDPTAVYTVAVTVKDDQGCIQSPTITKYVKDQTPADCYPTIETETWGAETPPAPQDVTQTVTLNIKNLSSLEDMTLTGLIFQFENSSTCSTGSPAHGFQVTSVRFGGTIADTTTRLAGTTHTIDLPSSPAQTLALNSGTNAAYPIAITFQWRGDRCGVVSTDNPITSMCLKYTLASEPGVVKICNIIGTETNNPVSCN